MIQDIVANVKQKMSKAIDKYKLDLAKIRTGRAHAGILDHVKVDYYGSLVPVSQVATVVVSDAQTLTVQPWEASLLSVIEKAIRDSNLGLNPATNGPLIRIPMPPLTAERRKELIKVVKTEGESAKVAIRNIRRDANVQLKNLLKNKEISEDDDRRTEDEVQKQTDKCISQIDALLQEKELDLATV